MKIPKYKAYVPMWDEVCNVVGNNYIAQVLRYGLIKVGNIYQNKELLEGEN